MEGSASSDGNQSVQVPSKVDDEDVPARGHSWQSRFEVLGVIGEGGGGRVLRANDRVSGIQVALKHPTDEAGRFPREIQVQRKAKHDHVMPILDHDPLEFGWFTMPLADTSLWRAAPEMLDDERFTVVEHVARGLRHAHSLSIVHRDIKPSNILLLNGRWVLADFGLVRRPRGETTEARTGSGFLGTEGFAAPETLASPGTATHVADIYSLGRTIAWMVSGIEPEGITPLLPDGPWLRLVARMTELDVDDRLQTLDHVLAELAEAKRRLRAERRTSWGSHPSVLWLDAIEAAVLIAIMGGGSEDGVGRSAATFGDITRNAPELTDMGIRLGLKQLIDRGIVERTSIETEYERLHGWMPSDLGWLWLEANKADLPLWKQRPPEPPASSGVTDDDIPF